MKKQVDFESTITAIFMILSEIAKKLDTEYVEYASSKEEKMQPNNNNYTHNKIGFEYERK